jgi:hypothetical protein
MDLFPTKTLGFRREASKWSQIHTTGGWEKVSSLVTSPTTNIIKWWFPIVMLNYPTLWFVNWVLYTTDDMLNIVKCYMLYIYNYIYSLVYILYLDIIMVWTSIGSAAFSSSRFPSLSGKQWLSSRQTQGVLHPRSSNPEKNETRIYY